MLPRKARSFIISRNAPCLLAGIVLLSLAISSIPFQPAIREGPSGIATFAAGPPSCGSSLPTFYVGSLSALGTSPTPTVSNVTVEAQYVYAEVNDTSGSGNVSSCVNTSATTQTNATGGWNLPLPIPANQCSGSSCTNYTGPFGPVEFSAPNDSPSGYFLTSQIQAPNVNLTFVQALFNVTVTPSRPAVSQC